MKVIFLNVCALLLISACAPATPEFDATKQIQLLKAQCLYIKSSYPFSVDADRELSKQEFIRYFSVTGLMATSKAYFDKNVKVKGQEQYQKLYQHFKQVEQIRDEFYPKLSDSPSFSFKIKTNSVARSVIDYYLKYDEMAGIRISGPRFYHPYNWSFLAQPITLTIKLMDDSQWKKQFEGNWAIFRFLDSGRIEHTDSDVYILHIAVAHEDDGNHDAELIFKLNRLSFYQKIRKEFDCPQ
ncbi:MAG: hypothetical protein GY951_16530 [Psychromonas sp.]|nr:hypothetical protein [Psychromonas sp.]